jgi:HEAT repeat protein
MDPDAFNRSAPIVAFAFWLGVAVAVITLVMLAVTVAMRWVARRRDRIYLNAIARWRPLIVVEPTATALPDLSAPERTGFIRVWNDVHSALRGGTTENLARIARELKLEEHLHGALESRSFHDRVMAIVALGHVRSARSFTHLATHLDDRSPIMSLCAARALMQADPQRAAPLLVARIVVRSDWSQGSIAAILQEAGGAIATGQLADVTGRAHGELASRLIRLLAGASADSAAPLIRDWLRSSADERVVTTCLQVISNPADLDCVRPLLVHPRWHVRMLAAATLGRLGVPGDDQRLITMLSDSQWWVRYRAAGALLHLSFAGRERLRQIQQTHTDPYARDIITQVLAEQAIGSAP